MPASVQVILLMEVKFIKMEKGLAYLAFLFCYLMSPMIALVNDESMEKTNEKIWLKLNGYKER